MKKKRTHQLGDEFGWWEAYEGDLSATELERWRLEAGLPRDAPIEFKVEYLHYYPRVKWCPGVTCEFNGEWHGHWSNARPMPGTAWTLVREVRP